MYMNNLDPSMAQPTLPVWAASPCVHIHIPTRLSSQLLQHTICDANSGQGPGLEPWGNTKEPGRPPPSQSSQGGEDSLGDKSEGSLGSTAEQLHVERAR